MSEQKSCFQNKFKAFRMTKVKKSLKKKLSNQKWVRQPQKIEKNYENLK